MVRQPIRFDDGAAYERQMGVWSRYAGQIFLDWLAPGTGLRWIDVGCGNGTFTDLLLRCCAPSEVQGIDPSEAQLVFARSRSGVEGATFHEGDAMALPFDDDRFDAAVMALVIFFVPQPAKGVAEMVRVVRPGGLVSAYVWDIPGGGSPTEIFFSELPGVGIEAPLPPQASASPIEALRELWAAAGLEAIETRTITVQRVFASFDEFWEINTATNLKGTLAELDAGTVARLKERVQSRLPVDADGRITYGARANAIKGRVPT
jgi:SAM-dependent methyltransferase